MRRAKLVLGAALLGCSALALAQQGPESLLPKGFDQPPPPPRAAPPAPRPVPRAIEPAAAPARPAAPASPAVGAAVAASPGTEVAAPAADLGTFTLPAVLPTLEELEAMSPEDLEALLGDRRRVDMPAGLRRAMKRNGIIAESEGGLPAWTLGRQNVSLVRALLAHNSGRLISRWGHILMRRALASRLDAPRGMDPAEFVALRTSLLVRMGEGEAARALAQDVDVAAYNPALAQAAIDAYVATIDFTGACPLVQWQGSARKDRQWQSLQGICSAFSSESASGLARLDRLGPGEGVEKIDLLLAQRYAGAGGRALRAVTIEWDDVSDMNPWRYGLTLGVGLEPPASLIQRAATPLVLMGATAPMVPFATRAAGADRAAAAGIFSSAAMVDLYSQIYSAGTEGEWAERATALQSAYLATAPGDRLSAIRQVWGDADGSPRFYSRQVLTAYAAARLPVSADFADDAPQLIASMLAAGLDANALRWAGIVPEASEGWALLALAAPQRGPVDTDTIDTFHDDDSSAEQRKTRFLIAGLAGLGRLPMDKARGLAEKYDFVLEKPTRWTRLIDAAAEVGNPTLVALLAGAGMQGVSWQKMPSRHLYHIVAALNRVGLSAEARMIAAEAVARG